MLADSPVLSVTSIERVLMVYACGEISERVRWHLCVDVASGLKCVDGFPGPLMMIFVTSRKHLSEFIGTCALMLPVGGNVRTDSPVLSRILH